MVMRKFEVSYHTTASVTVTVELDCDENASIDDLMDVITDAGYEGTPDVCAQCSGWGRDYGLELGEWELDDDEGDMKAVTEVLSE